MPITAYSNRFQCELDPDQLLNRGRGAGEPTVDDLGEILPQARVWIAKDIVCSSCGMPGAQIVRSARKVRGAGTRQSHFRFTGPDGADAHHPLCEFHNSESGASGDGLLSFIVGRGSETAWVRQIVCRGLHYGSFGQNHIRAMRQWFFDTRAANQFRLTITGEAVEWTVGLRRSGSISGISFHPSHGDLPNFLWRGAAVTAFHEANSQLMLIVRNSRTGIDAGLIKRAKILLQKSHGKAVFDVEALRSPYDLTLRLARFIAENSDYPSKSRNPYAQPPPAMLALCALMLHMWSWDMSKAIAAFIWLLRAPPVDDQTMGNVMGLNPFHDYEGWALLRLAQQAAQLSPGGFSLKLQIDRMEEDLRSRHLAWVVAGRPL